MCCFFDKISNFNCVSNLERQDHIGSCSNILSKLYLEVWTISAGISVLIINSISCLSWIKVEMMYISFKLFGCFLCVCDLLVSLVLIILYHVHLSTISNTVYIAFIWKTSTFCKGLGGLLIFATQASNVITLVIAFDRLLFLAIHPFRRQGFTGIQAVLCLLMTGLLAGGLVLVYALLRPVDITNAACIMVGTSLSVHASLIALITNFIIFLLLFGICIFLYHSVVQIGRINPRMKVSIKLVLHLVSVVVTNFTAWAVISFISILVYAGVPFLPSVEAVVSIILYSTNSFINPFLNNAWMVVFKKIKLRKKFNYSRTLKTQTLITQSFNNSK